MTTRRGASLWRSGKGQEGDGLGQRKKRDGPPGKEERREGLGPGREGEAQERGKGFFFKKMFFFSLFVLKQF